MKAVEREMLLGIIILVVILVIVMLIVVNPSLSFGEMSKTQIDFRQFCLFWSLTGYNTGAEEILVDKDTGEMASISDLCRPVLLIFEDRILTLEEKEKCANICRGTV